MNQPNWYEGPPTVGPEEGEDDWFEQAQMGKVDIDENNDLSGGDLSPELPGMWENADFEGGEADNDTET